MKSAILIVILHLIALPALRCAGASEVPAVRTGTALSNVVIAELSALKNDVNSVYGALNINRGPCGRFARLFHARWNKRFAEKCHIVFVMSPEDKCYHVLVRLPDGSLYDGGNGVMTDRALLKQWPEGTRIDEMLQFDLTLLDKRSYGLNRDYPSCPNYSDARTFDLIERHLAKLSAGSIRFSKPINH